MLLPYKRLSSSVVEKIPDWVIAGTSPSGWINNESLYEYLCNAFDKWLTDNSVERPVIVWSDSQWHKLLKWLGIQSGKKIRLLLYLLNAYKYLAALRPDHGLIMLNPQFHTILYRA